MRAHEGAGDLAVEVEVSDLEASGAFEAVGVAGVDGAGQGEPRPVRHRDGMVPVPRPDHRQDRPEYLLLGEVGLGARFAEDRRPDEPPFAEEGAIHREAGLASPRCDAMLEDSALRLPPSSGLEVRRRVRVADVEARRGLHEPREERW